MKTHQSRKRRSRKLVWGGVLLLTVLAGGLVYAALTTTAQSHLSRGITYWENGEKPSALIEFRAAISKDPQLAQAREFLGQWFLEDGRYPAAIEAFEYLVAREPNSARLQRKLAQAFLGAKKNEEAHQALLVARKLEPDHPELLTVQAEYLANTSKDWEEVERMLKLAIQKAPGDPAPYNMIAQVSRQRKDLSESRKWFEKSLVVAPDNFEALMGLGYLDMEEKQWEAAEERFRAVSLAYENSEMPHVALAGLFRKKQEPEKVLKELRAAVDRRPDELSLQYQLAKELLKQQDIEEGMKVVDGMLAIQPSNPQVKFLKGQMLFKQEAVKEAIAEFQSVVSRQPDFTLAHWLLGQAYEKEGFVEQARREYEILVDQIPNSYQGRERLVALALKRQDYTEALNQVGALISRAPHHPAIQRLAGKTFLQANKPKDAAKYFADYLAANPNDANAYFNYGLSLMFSGTLTEAFDQFSIAIQNEKKLVAGLGSLALTLELGDKSRWADRVVNFMEQQAPDSAVAPFIEGKLAVLRGTPNSKAIANFQRALERTPTYYPALVEMGKLYRSEGRYPLAEQQFLTILQNDSQHLEALHELGEIFLAQEEWTKAVGYFQQTVKVRQDYGRGWNNLAWALMKEGNNLDEALSAAKKAKELLPDKPEILDTLGMVYLAQRKYEHALLEFERAVVLREDSPTMRYHLALTYKHLGQVEKARGQVERALSKTGAFPDQAEARELLRMLKASS